MLRVEQRPRCGWSRDLWLRLHPWVPHTQHRHRSRVVRCRADRVAVAEVDAQVAVTIERILERRLPGILLDCAIDGR